MPGVPEDGIPESGVLQEEEGEGLAGELAHVPEAAAEGEVAVKPGATDDPGNPGTALDDDCVPEGGPPTEERAVEELVDEVPNGSEGTEVLPVGGGCPPTRFSNPSDVCPESKMAHSP